VEQGNGGRVRKYLYDLTGANLACDVRIMAETEELQPLAYRFSPQTTVGPQVSAIGGVGCGFEARENGCYLPVAGTSSGFVWDSQRCIYGYQSRRVGGDSIGDEIQHLVIIAKDGGGSD
jgi:hypothetical protein